jgi:hypothetical protein
VWRAKEAESKRDEVILAHTFMEAIILIVLVIQAIAFGFFTQVLATAKGYPSTRYFWIGLFFSFLGLLFVMGLPAVPTAKPATDASKKCPFCAELIKKEARVCRYCGRDVPPTSATSATI